MAVPLARRNLLHHKGKLFLNAASIGTSLARVLRLDPLVVFRSA